MKKVILTGLVLIISVFVFAGIPSVNNNKDATVLVSGKVIDKNSGEEITGAQITIDSKIIYSDLDGNFSALININNTNAEIKYVSYKDTQVKINPFAYNTLTIELASK